MGPQEREKKDFTKPTEQKPDEREGEKRRGVTEEDDHNEYIRKDSRDEPDRDLA